MSCSNNSPLIQAPQQTRHCPTNLRLQNVATPRSCHTHNVPSGWQHDTTSKSLDVTHILLRHTTTTPFWLDCEFRVFPELSHTRDVVELRCGFSGLLRACVRVSVRLSVRDPPDRLCGLEGVCVCVSLCLTRLDFWDGFASAFGGSYC